MASTTFTGGTVIASTWLNDVDDFVYGVKSAGAVGDGVTSDQTALVNAVATAVLTGASLYWPVGTFVSTANIPNLHSVKHIGPGIIKRGSNLFYVDPIEGITNTLFVAASGGSDANDGLSSTEAFATTQAAANSIYGYSWADATWKLQHAAGTYTQAVTLSKKFPSPNRVQFLGAAVADGTSPTTIFAAPVSTNIGLYFQNGCFGHVEDIKFTGFSGTNGGGVTAFTSSDIYLRNVWADSCFEAIQAQLNSTIRVQAGKLTNCTTGISITGCCSYTIGYNGTAADVNGATGVAISTCTTGLLISENSAGHVDYTHISSCTNVGLDAQSNSRVHLVGSVFATNNINLRARGNANINENPSIPNTFGTATSSSKIYRSGSVEVNAYQDAAGYFAGIVRDTTTRSNATAVASSVTQYTFTAGQLSNRGSGFKLSFYGDVVGVAGTKVVEVKLGGVSLGTRTIAAATTDWRCEVEAVVRTAANDIRTSFVVLENAGVTTMDTKVLATIDMTASQALEIFITGNGTDTMRYHVVTLDLVLM